MIDVSWDDHKKCPGTDSSCTEFLKWPPVICQKFLFSHQPLPTLFYCVFLGVDALLSFPVLCVPNSRRRLTLISSSSPLFTSCLFASPLRLISPNSLLTAHKHSLQFNQPALWINPVDPVWDFVAGLLPHAPLGDTAVGQQQLLVAWIITTTLNLVLFYVMPVLVRRFQPGPQ